VRILAAGVVKLVKTNQHILLTYLDNFRPYRELARAHARVELQNLRHRAVIDEK
jgi:hypothetical protein